MNHTNSSYNYWTIPIINIQKNTTICFNNNAFDIKSNATECYGVKNIPNKINLLYFQDNKDTESIRYGYWINNRLLLQNQIYFIYDRASGMYIPKRESRQDLYANKIQEYFMYMVNDASNKIDQLEWKYLCNAIKTNKDHGNGSEGYIYVDQSMCTLKETSQLNKIISARGSELDRNEQHYLDYIDIQFKSAMAIRKGYEMIDYYDTSNYLQQVIEQHSIQEIINQMKIAYANMNYIGNFGSAEHWQLLIKLICQSETFFKDEKNISIKIQIDELISHQLESLSEECVASFIEERLWREVFGDNTKSFPKILNSLYHRQIFVQDDSNLNDGNLSDGNFSDSEFNDSNSDSDAPAIAGHVTYRFW
ncbi:hypothetical protein TBLA_0D00590 [Henningerozyma blattae CBS 6284]|uniref:AAR2 C-terminal domain-containing protein n=1 Tax=Henningerozyma blattae (strain ATCC 34711 / CBS 6284 / DSM 70876 / NBRC 10599 / NRRL Y-10934 / UCD 77-7) TaxID=1071380 RepID=I2H2G4_HENB6|nr:hypothetical protein TBLA_0D00590 [Tetrapisispora blattae CBS 6284]CCH60566.1 hypothetical protein TBLA_0D00590 [Tetrapisispora blattae CBS 6284]